MAVDENTGHARSTKKTLGTEAQSWQDKNKNKGMLSSSPMGSG